MIWSARPVSYYAYAGHEQHANTTQTARAMSILYALTGSFDREGGNVLFPSVPQAAITGEDLPGAKTMRPTVGLETRPLGPARTGRGTVLCPAVVRQMPTRVELIQGILDLLIL